MLPLNPTQRRILFITCLLFAFSSMYVPWKVSPLDPNHIHLASLGYRLVFDPPNDVSAVVDWSPLLLTWSTLAAITAALVLLTASPFRREP